MNPTDITNPPSSSHRGHPHHRHDKPAGEHLQFRHWSPTLIAARFALLALSLGGAFWSTRWAWQQVSGR